MVRSLPVQFVQRQPSIAFFHPRPRPRNATRASPTHQYRLRSLLEAPPLLRSLKGLREARRSRSTSDSTTGSHLGRRILLIPQERPRPPVWNGHRRWRRGVDGSAAAHPSESDAALPEELGEEHKVVEHLCVDFVRYFRARRLLRVLASRHQHGASPAAPLSIIISYAQSGQKRRRGARRFVSSFTCLAGCKDDVEKIAFGR